MRLALGFLLGLAACGTGCHPKPVPDPMPPPGPAQDLSVVDAEPTPPPTCATAAALKQEDVCEGYFTRDNLACARCTNVVGCVDSAIMMYCATGPCAFDPACRYVDDPLMSAKKASKKGSRRP